MAIGRPTATGFATRVVVAAVLGTSPAVASLRGGDETTFLFYARDLQHTPLGISGWIDALEHNLHYWVFAVQIKLFNSPDLALRVTQAAIAVAALVLFAAAVYDLAGPRAARIAAWVLALEPANVFFSGLLHKESLMLLAAGLIAYGGAGLWTRATLTSVVPMLAGCAIAIATRQYAGMFMTASAAAITLHASLRAPARQSLAGVALLVLAVLVVGGAGPRVLAGSNEELAKLQVAVDANATDPNANLRLERVNVSTPDQAARSLPKRIRDVLLRPYPWEVRNASQRVGVVGTLFLFVGLCLLIQALARNRGAIIRRAGPLLYLLVFEASAYGLAAGNAGTAFRYRTHLVAVGICLVVVLRERYRQEQAAAPELDAAPTPAPASLAYAP